MSTLTHPHTNNPLTDLPSSASSGKRTTLPRIAILRALLLVLGTGLSLLAWAWPVMIHAMQDLGLYQGKSHYAGAWFSGFHFVGWVGLLVGGGTALLAAWLLDPRGRGNGWAAAWIVIDLVAGGTAVLAVVML